MWTRYYKDKKKWVINKLKCTFCGKQYVKERSGTPGAGQGGRGIQKSSTLFRLRTAYRRDK